MLGNWDKIKAKKKFPKKKYHIEICGCILPNDPTVKAAPHAKNFIIRPIGHHRTQHVSSSAADVPEGPSIPKKYRPDNTIVLDDDGQIQVHKSIEITVSESAAEATGPISRSTNAFLNV